MRSWPIAAVETEMRRLKVLAYLNHASTYEANATTLRLQCKALGVPTTSDQLLAAIQWLAEMEAVTLRNIDTEPVAKLTPLGRDVADGAQILPGVMRPDP